MLKNVCKAVAIAWGALALAVALSSGDRGGALIGLAVVVAAF
jgi:hypothetical protein